MRFKNNIIFEPRHTLQRKRTAFHTVIKSKISTAEPEKINQWSATHIKAEEEIWAKQSKNNP